MYYMIFIKITVKIKIYFTILFLYAIIHSLNTIYSDLGVSAAGDVHLPTSVFFAYRLIILKR